MTSIEWIDLLVRVSLGAIWVGAVSYAVFVVGYAWRARHVWWRTWPGVAVMTASTSSLLLLGLTLVFQKVEVSPLVGAAVTCGIVVLIAAGGFFKAAALLLGAVRHDEPQHPPDPH